MCPRTSFIINPVTYRADYEIASLLTRGQIVSLCSVFTLCSVTHSPLHYRLLYISVYDKLENALTEVIRNYIILQSPWLTRVSICKTL